jgi:hypothetical protein
MTTNLDRLKKDVDRLIARGELLTLAMDKELRGDAFVKQIRASIGEEKGNELLKALPNFATEYEAWYSQSLALLRQLLPARVANFVGLYEKPKGRKEITNENYVIQDYLQGLSVTFYGKVTVDRSAAVSQLNQQLAIVKAAKTRFESSLFEMRQIVQADVFDSEISAARELQKNKFLRAAGAVAGVVLEKHLRQVCDDRSITVTKKNPGIGDLNELLKDNSVIEVPQWRHVSMLGDIRNLCVHNKSKEPTDVQVTDLLDGTDKVLKTIT